MPTSIKFIQQVRKELPDSSIERAWELYTSEFSMEKKKKKKKQIDQKTFQSFFKNYITKDSKTKRY